MAIYEDAKAAQLEIAIIVGRDADGKVQLFLEDADREKLIVLLERAKTHLIRSLDP